MRKLFKRVLAYVVDLMVVLIITQSLSGIPQINPQIDKYNKYYDDYMTLFEDWTLFKGDLVKYFDDKELSEEEYNKLVDKHDNYVEVLNTYYKDNKLTKGNYDKLIDKIDNNYKNEYKDIYYKIEKNSILYFVLYLVTIFGYFVLFAKYTGGQTLGKKLMRLKIVNNKDEKVSVPIWKYCLRALILYQPIYYIVKLIGVNFMVVDMYYDVTSIVYNIQGYLEMLIIVMVMMRLDGRGPQDLIAGTKVVLYDREGNYLEDKQDIISKRIDELKNSSKKDKITKKRNSKKVIDEEPTE